MADHPEFDYLLDTNIISDLIRFPQGTVYDRILSAGSHTVCTSIIVACELRFGAAKKASKKLTQQVEAILQVLPILLLESPVDQEYAKLRNEQERSGYSVGPNDLFIAAQSRCYGMTLVTANQKEFSRIKRLKTVNWLAS